MSGKTRPLYNISDTNTSAYKGATYGAIYELNAPMI